MSEANNVWRIEPEAVEREIEIEHSTMSGKIVVKLDGEVVGDDRMLARKKDVSFDVDGHPAVVTVHFAHAGFSAKSDLHVDDRYVEPLKR